MLKKIEVNGIMAI